MREPGVIQRFTGRAMAKGPLHIGFFAPALPTANVPNGIVTYTRIMRDALIAFGHEVTVTDGKRVLRTDGSVEDMPSSGLTNRARDRIGRMLTPYSWVYGGRVLAREIAQLHRGRPFDVFEMEESFGWARHVCLDVPVVLRLHGPHFLGKNEKEAAPAAVESERRVRDEGRAMVHADGVTSPSARMLAATLARYDLRGAKHAAIPNPMPVRSPDRLWSRSSADPHQVLCVGRFDLRKGADVALKAFAQAADIIPHLELVFVGPDNGIDENGKVLKFTEYLYRHVSPSIRERIVYHGSLPPGEVERLRYRSGISIVCSRFENFAYSVAENMAIGAPAIVSDSFGNAEMIEHGRSGLVTPVANIVALADAIKFALDHPDRFAAMGAAAYLRCRDWLSPQRVAEETVDYYRDVIEQRSR